MSKCARAWTHARAWASLLLTSVPSTSKITPRARRLMAHLGFPSGRRLHDEANCPHGAVGIAVPPAPRSDASSSWDLARAVPPTGGPGAALRLLGPRHFEKPAPVRCSPR